MEREGRISAFRRITGTCAVVNMRKCVRARGEGCWCWGGGELRLVLIFGNAFFTVRCVIEHFKCRVNFKGRSEYSVKEENGQNAVHRILCICELILSETEFNPNFHFR